MNINPCAICGEMPIIEKISSHWWNATHDECDGEPGISMVNSPSANHAVKKWNQFQKKIARREVAIIRVDWLAAEQSMHLTAFGGQPSRSIPLQLSLFADDPSAKHGGR